MDNKFGNNLKYLRKSKSLTQQEMADILSIPRQGYAKYENSLGEPDISTLTKLADYFNINVDSILGRHSNCGNLNLDSTKLSSFYE